MRHITTAVIAVSFVANSAFAGLPKSWKEIEQNDKKFKKSPQVSDYRIACTVPSSGLEWFKVGDRFGILFEEGMPLVAFDFSMEPLSWKDQILGAIGIGGWSLKNFWNKYKKIKEKPTEVLEQAETLKIGQFPEPGADDHADYGSFYSDLLNDENLYSSAPDSDEVAGGYKVFAKLKFKDDWIIKNGHEVALKQGRRDGFAPASFTLADIYIEKQKDQEKLFEKMKEAANVLFKHDLQAKELDSFLAQFNMKWDESKKEFSLVWAPRHVRSFVAQDEKQPPLPVWVVNYFAPLDIIAYKYSLHNLERNTAALESVFGTYGTILGIFISRLTNGLKSRMDNHEGQFQAIVEAYQRGEYEMTVPFKDPEACWDQTITLLYLNKMIDTDDITDGHAKREEVLEKEAKNRKKVLDWLEKKKFTVDIWQDQRFATVSKNGKIKGIASLTIGRHWLSRQPSFHHYNAATWYKHTQRVALEVFADAVRMVMPTQLSLGKYLKSWLAVGIQIYIPTVFWDGLFRGRAFTEIGYEGFSTMMVNEAIHGRWGNIPGYDGDALVDLKGTLSSQRANVFEVPVKYEDVAIETNMKNLNELLGMGLNQELRLTKH